jgi:predicted aspartyl protease
MRTLTMTIAAAALAACLAAPAAAHAQPTASAATASRTARLDALFKAADRGEIAPLVAALRDERDGDVRALLEGRLAVMRLDFASAANPRLRRLAAQGSPPDLREHALSTLASLAFTQGDYAEAARLGASLKAVQTARGNAEAAQATEISRRMADILASQPRQMLERPLVAGRTAARRDPAGLMRIDVSINGQAQDAVFDTGANLSVLTSSAARRLGVRMLDGTTSVGNAVQSQVPVRLGIADRVEIAGNVLRNVVFLVIEDAQLTFAFPGGSYSIPAIIGYPVMQQLRRFTMTADSFSVEPSQGRARAGDGHNLHGWGNELFVDARVGGRSVPLHLDTGANPSHLDPLFAEAFPDVVRELPREERRLQGAGGSATGQAARWRNVGVEIGGRTFRAPSVLIGLPGGPAPSRYYGVAGIDLLRAFASYTIDLGVMRLELGEPVAPTTPAAR